MSPCGTNSSGSPKFKTCTFCIRPALLSSSKTAEPTPPYSFVSILGATVDLGLLWSIADTFNGLMSIPNLIALLLLSGTVVKLVKEFFAKEPQ